MTTADRLIEKGAERLQELSAQLAEGNGLKAKLASELAEDADFLRKLKPSAMAARAHGEVPPEDASGAAPSRPQLEPRPKPARPRGGGVNPLLVVGVAFAVGYVLARVVDWRSHAHPRL